MVIEVGPGNFASREMNGKTLTARSKIVQIHTKLPASLAKYSPKTWPGVSFIFKVPERSTVSDLIKYLRIPETEVGAAFVNGFQRPGDFHLKNDDSVRLFPVEGSWVI